MHRLSSPEFSTIWRLSPACLQAKMEYGLGRGTSCTPALRSATTCCSCADDSTIPLTPSRQQSSSRKGGATGLDAGNILHRSGEAFACGATQACIPVRSRHITSSCVCRLAHAWQCHALACGAGTVCAQPWWTCRCPPNGLYRRAGTIWVLHKHELWQRPQARSACANALCDLRWKRECGHPHRVFFAMMGGCGAQAARHAAASCWWHGRYIVTHRDSMRLGADAGASCIVVFRMPSGNC